MENEISLERMLFNLNTLSELGEETTSSSEFNRMIKSSLYMVMGSFFASRGVVLQYDRDKKEFFPISSKGVGDITGLAVPLDADTLIDYVKSGRPVDIKGVDAAAMLLGQSKEIFERLGTRFLTFLSSKDGIIGIICMNGKYSGESYTEYDYQFLSVMAQHIAFSMHNHILLQRLMHKYTENKGLYDNLSRIYYDTIHAFAASIDAKDKYTKGHSHRVSAYCAIVGREIGWESEEIEGIRIAGLMHDIGKIAVDKSIINKASPLTNVEHRELNGHPVVGYEILSKIKFPWKGIPVMSRNHHEKVDGSGYPDRLKKNDIHIGARVMALVDAFDAMTTDRPYRPRLSFREAIDQIKACMGKQFDPDVVAPFIDVIKKEVSGEVEKRSIVPLLQEQLDLCTVNGMLEGFPGQVRI